MCKLESCSETSCIHRKKKEYRKSWRISLIVDAISPGVRWNRGIRDGRRQRGSVIARSETKTYRCWMIQPRVGVAGNKRDEERDARWPKPRKKRLVYASCVLCSRIRAPRERRGVCTHGSTAITASRHHLYLRDTAKPRPHCYCPRAL